MAESDLRPAGGAGNEGPGRGCADAGPAFVRGSGSDRNLGLELRRVHESERPVSASGALSYRGGGVTGDPLGSVRQRLHRAVQRIAEPKQGRLRPRVTAYVCEWATRKPATGARQRR